jgi:hypothetical protein
MGFNFKLFHFIYIIFFLEFLKPYFEFYVGSKIPFIFLYIALIVIAIIIRTTHEVYRIKLFPIDYSIIVLYLIGVLYLVLSSDFKTAISGFKNNFIFVYLYFFIRIVDPKPATFLKFLKFFTVFFFLVGFYGIYQYFFDYYTIALKFNFTKGTSESYFGLSEDKYEVYNIRRAYGLFKYWTAFGYSTMMGAVFTLCLLLNTAFRKNIYNFMLLILIVAMVLSMSRTSYIAFLIGAVITYRSYNKIPINIIIFISVLIALIFFIGHEISETILSRIFSTFSLDPSKSSSHSSYLFKNISNFFESPFGIGLGGTENSKEWVESAFFKFSREIGIFPALIVVFIFFYSIWSGYELLKCQFDDKNIKIIIIYSISIIAGFFVAGINFPLWFSWFPEGIMWLLMAYVINIKENKYQFMKRT